MRPQECCVLIPSLSPDERLPAYVRELTEAGFGLVLVVDDGSKEVYQPIFDRIAQWAGCHVLHHEVNRGKGAALRTGYEYIQAHTELKGVITADSDGQHTVPDTLKLADKLTEEKALLLGSRDFSRKSTQVPPKSRFGNRVTSCVFRLLYGQWLPDTQTGLRAFPAALLDFMLDVKGDRFEYEMNVLTYCAGHHVPMIAVPIETVYLDENKSTHFHPFRDSWRIYKLLLGNFFKFMSASFIATLVDLLLFTILKHLFGPGTFLWLYHAFRIANPYIFVATVLARICSGSLNFFLNKSFVFPFKKSKGALGRYAILFVCVMCVSGYAVSFISDFTHISDTIVKIVVDTILFCVNYRIQKSWVFREDETASD